MLLVLDSWLLAIGPIDMLLGFGRPHALFEDVLEVKVEVELQILWFLLQPRVFLLLPRAAFEDEWIQTENAHHLLHILGRMGCTQRGTSGGGWRLYAGAHKRRGGLDDERSVDGF